MTESIALSAGKRLLLEKLRRGEGARTADVLPTRPAGEPLPLTPEQTHVWLHGSMAPHLPLYNEPITIHRRGAFDHAVFEAAFNELIRRHEIWRTAFVATNGEVVQEVRPQLRVELPITDLTHLPEREREAEAVRLATEEARRPIDPTRAPLMHPRLVKLADDDHRLFLPLHHLVFDGVTLNRVLLPEFAAIYAALAAGREPDLPALPLQYGDYACWRTQRLEGAALEMQLSYWRERLADLPALELAGDRPRPPATSHAGGSETFSLTPDFTASLREFCRRENVTAYATLLAAFKALLHRYTGQDDLAVGSVVDTRTRPELQRLMGYFLNSVVLRTRPARDRPFRDYLAEVRETALAAMAAAEAPFDRVVRELAPQRDPGRHPLFQVMFSMQPQAPSIDGWDLTQMEVDTGVSKFDLFLEVEERPDTVIGRFVYSADLFDAATVRRMIDGWTALLEAAVARPDRPLGDLPAAPDAEIRRLLVDWNDTARPCPQTTVHGAIEAQALRTPDAVAVEFEDGATWTYAQLDARAERLAARLAAAGAKRGQLVAVCLERSFDQVAGLLAVMKTGAAYLPLDPALPPARLALLTEEAGAMLALTQRSLAPQLPKTVRTVLCDARAALPALGRPSVEVGPQDVAYVLFTSGSTGKPKGVEIPHRAVVNLTRALQEAPGFGPADTMLALAPLTFDASVAELFLPLVTGGRTILATRDTAADPARLATLIQATGVTTVAATPTTWRSLLDEGWAGGAGLRIFCGGEALTRELTEQLLPRCAELWNMYGPTEATVYSAIQRITAGEDGPVPIGRPIANARLFVLDAGGAPAPVGVPGELYIGGAGVGLRYRNREDLTAERFVTRAVAPGDTLYRTGDIARWRADGTVECLGRRDDQVKVRGFRIELGEVEAAVAACPGVGAAAIKASPDVSGALSLTAFVAGRPGAATPDPGELRRRLAEALPDYMVPARVVVLPALPTTNSGKVDRQALKAPEPTAAPAADFIAPKGNMERKLAAIWAEVLGVSRVGALDSFFALGGHSILAAKLLRRIEVAFGKRLTLSDVFRAPDVRRMAGVLAAAGAPARPRVNDIQPGGTRPPLFWLNGGALFWPLANALGKDQPFLGLRRDTAVPLPENFSLAELAPQMIQAMRAIQPQGPYFVGGWCAWGVLAYETARQLTAEGQDVGLVLMLDPPHPGERRAVGRMAMAASKLRLHAGQIARRRGTERWAYLRDRLDGAVGRLEEALDPAEVGQQSRFGATIGKACLRYEPQPYDGAVALFIPEERPDVEDPGRAWAPLVSGPYSALDLPGDHGSMLKSPQVEVLASAMDEALRAARRAR
ncbi:non-ribosomal peptide synthetase [Caulobacter sp. 17J65-9]|uniref:non-ribosomal peptide synthetase n=1 Tax=Caulobacter sp. 17J65-9 TaxID=2709382 RepID=UPI0013C60376|nr:non-ribosomal peptide synthetase [Caulobacter sp. 17J65-9]NEX91435.1 amino acid adenylation domain-containing protein [Caulobacter sp. 17J65-9]